MYSYPSEQEFLLEETRSAFTSVPDQIVLELANIFRADLDFIERIWKLLVANHSYNWEE